MCHNCLDARVKLRKVYLKHLQHTTFMVFRHHIKIRFCVYYTNKTKSYLFQRFEVHLYLCLREPVGRRCHPVHLHLNHPGNNTVCLILVRNDDSSRTSSLTKVKTIVFQFTNMSCTEEIKKNLPHGYHYRIVLKESQIPKS